MPKPTHERAISGLLPLFNEKSSSISMMTHALDVVRDATEFLNHGQIAVITADQLLFAILKSIQWKIPTYDESKFIVLMGGLHIEMAASNCLSDILADTGWTEVCKLVPAVGCLCFLTV